MGWDALGAIGSFGQFLVVLGAAFFGFAQLRVARRQSELQATIPYFAYTRSTEFVEAFRIVRPLAADPTSEPALREAIGSADFTDGRVTSLFYLANFFNELGVLVQENMIDEQIVLPFFAWQVVATWDVFRPYVVRRRGEGARSMMVGFESLVVRSRDVVFEDRFRRARRRLPSHLRSAFDASVATSTPADASSTPDPSIVRAFP